MASRAVLLLASALLTTLQLAAALRPVRQLQYAQSSPITRKSVEMSPSVSVFFLNDVLLSYNDDGTLTNRCIEMLDRAAAFNAKRVNFVITHYFADMDGDAIPDWYCLRKDQDLPCEQFGVGVLQAYMAGLKACFAKAVGYGLEIGFVPHVDDGSNTGSKIWRNALNMDPLKMYGNWTYTGNMLKPVAQILADVLVPGLRVWFCMQGEMNLAVMNHPVQFTQLYSWLKNLILKGKGPGYQVSIGICMNFNKLNGMEFVTSAQEAQQLFDVPRVQQIFQTVDFIGISNYPQVLNSGDLSEMETAMKQLERELGFCGLSLKALTQSRELVLCEYGFGGGVANSGDKPATTAAQVGYYSYFGIHGPYRRAMDPWQTWQAEGVSVPARDAVRDLYDMTASYLATGGLQEYRVDALFLWNVASWDLLGIHWRSYSEEGSYYEPGVAREVAEHNRRVNNIPLGSALSGSATASITASSAP